MKIIRRINIRMEGGAYGIYGREQNYTRNFSQKPEGRDHLECLGVGGRLYWN
jgi:hypothetical protein